MQIARAAEDSTPGLLEVRGVCPDGAAALLISAGDNPERLVSEASFAALCGTSPVETSSGKTQRRRLNRGGDRQANAALYRIVLSRLRWDDRTRDYLQRRLRARHGARSSAASNATSRVRSTDSSSRQTLRLARPEPLGPLVDIHRGIKLAVRYEATVLVVAINKWL